jgi:hypothetical protein
MKKILLITVFTVIAFSSVFSKAEGVVDKIFLYIPNRIIDIVDTFTLELGAGPVVRAELQLTEAFQFGAGVGATAKAVKGYNRQYGGCLENGWNAGFTCIMGEDMERSDTTRWVQEYWEDYSGFPRPSQEIYNFYTGARDYWAIGGTLGLGIEGTFFIHPVEIVDLITGILFFDIKGDDLIFEDFE